jgi:hypothetical protein
VRPPCTLPDAHQAMKTALSGRSASGILWGVSRRGEHVHAAGVVQGQSRVIAQLVPAAAVLELEGARAIDGAVT